MSFILRPYQETSVQKIVNFMRSSSKDNGLAVLPTGSGKSLVIASSVKRLGDPTLIFQPSVEILNQNVSKMRYYGYEPGVYSASAGRKEIKDITFATIGSVKSKAELFKNFKYIMVDEAHLVNSKGGMYEDFLNSLGTRVVGLTATPYRLNTDGFGGSMLKFLTRTRPKIFKQLIHYVQNRELFDAGYLCPLTYWPMPGFDNRKLKKNSTGADYDDDSVRRYFSEINFPAMLIKATKSLLDCRKNLLVFTRFIHEAEALCKAVPDCRLITAKTPKKERKKLFEDYLSGKFPALANVGIATTGIDFPELETVLISRPTMSLALWYQMIGRGIRTHEGKKNCWVVDMADNLRLFGKIEDLEIRCDKGEQYYISNGGRQLTNVYFE